MKVTLMFKSLCVLYGCGIWGLKEVPDIVRVHVFALKRCLNVASQIPCPVCKTEPKNEIHFLLKCPAYLSIRQEFIPLMIGQPVYKNILKSPCPTKSGKSFIVYLAFQCRRSQYNRTFFSFLFFSPT